MSHLWCYFSCERWRWGTNSRSPPWESPLAAQELQTWWIPPGWEGRSHRGRSAGCWGPPLPRWWSALLQTLLEEMSPASYPEESPRRHDRWWSTGSRPSCWSPLRREEERWIRLKKLYRLRRYPNLSSISQVLTGTKMWDSVNSCKMGRNSCNIIFFCLSSKVKIFITNFLLRFLSVPDK